MQCDAHGALTDVEAFPFPGPTVHALPFTNPTSDLLHSPTQILMPFL
jgi:hypothetical protein